MADACRPVETWPVVLLGPMVRRVTPDAVSVFIATSVAATAQLAVRPGRLLATQLGDGDFAPNPVVTLDRLGDRLWVGLVQARLPGDSARGQVYSYDVRITEGATRRGLRELGELGDGFSADDIQDSIPLGYTAGFLPSFVVVPGDVTDLRLAQASCRKPHGGVEDEPDALTILDEVIALSLGVSPTMPAEELVVGQESVTLPEAPPPSNRQRPHQLLLTGDQIYADDVATALGVAITEAAGLLLGWEEHTPGVNLATSFMTAPGWRSRFLDQAGFVEAPDVGSVDYAANHLLTFAEWCAMYVFAWSDALWKRTADGLGVELPEPGERLFVSEGVKLLDYLALLGQNVVPPTMTRWVELAGKLDEFPKYVSDTWWETRDPAMAFGATVRRVRRLLANVSTLTMFDDHDVTDDWYLNGDTAEAMLAQDKDVATDGEISVVGPRLIRNALSAYAIFQHWGNVPDDFGMGEVGEPRDGDRLGARLLAAWVTGDIDPDTGHVDVPTLGFEGGFDGALDLTHEADVLLGLTPFPSPVPPLGTARHEFERMRWDYSIDFGCYRLVALDTRTWRDYPSAPTPFEWAGAPGVEPSPLDTASRDYVEQLAAAWDAAAALGSADNVETFATLLRAVQAAAAETVTTDLTGYLADVADLTEALISATWPPSSVDAAATELARYRAGGGLSAGRATQLWQASVLLDNLSQIPVSVDLEPLSHALDHLGRYLQTEASGTSAQMAPVVAGLSATLNDDLIHVLSGTPQMEAIVRQAVNEVGPPLAEAIVALVPDEWQRKFFRDGTGQLGAGLISRDALAFQLTDAVVADDPNLAPGAQPPTVIVSPAPVFGNTLVEIVQRLQVVKVTLQGGAGAVEWEYEAWAANAPALAELFGAAQALSRCVVLSGDVHYANSSVNDVTMLLDGVSTRYVQLTSSAARNADWKTTKFGLLDDMLWEDSGAFHLSQMALRAVEGNPQPDGPSLIGWAEEIGAEWAEETFSVEHFAEWLDGKLERLPLTPLELARWQVMAPLNSAKSYLAESVYSAFELVKLARELSDDPKEVIFGDYLTARDVIRQQLIDLYKDIGVDHAYGFAVKRTMLRDLRPDRVDQYPARRRFAKYDRQTSNIRAYADIQEVQTVGHNNVGLVSFTGSGGVVDGVRHELLWFIVPEPEAKLSSPGLVVGAPVRDDWMGTVHECGWTSAAHRYYPPPTTGLGNS